MAQQLNQSQQNNQPLKFKIFNGNYPENIKNSLIKRGIWEEIPQEYQNVLASCQFIWKPSNFNVREYARINELKQKLKFKQVINHFENNNGICTKPGLVRSLRTFYALNQEASFSKYSVFDSTPTSFLLTAGIEDFEFLSFQARYKELAKGFSKNEHMPIKHCQKNVWLIKPANMNQGKGIQVFNQWKEIVHFLGNKKLNTYWVVQKYIERPLLYDNRKFDVRVWALFTDKGQVYFYKQGYIRTTSSYYNLGNLTNFIHLTNQCLQIKDQSNYGKFEDGNTLSFDDLERYLNIVFPNNKINIGNHILPRIKSLIIDTYLCVDMVNLNPNKRKHCFELFGYDFLIDDDFRVWLLEVNTNPYIGTPNDFIKNLVPKMIDDMFDLTLDQIYKPSQDSQYVRERQFRQNDFQLIYQNCPEYYENFSKYPIINLRESYQQSLYPIQNLVIQNITQYQVIQSNIQLSPNKKFQKNNGYESKLLQQKTEQETFINKQNLEKKNEASKFLKQKKNDYNQQNQSKSVSKIRNEQNLNITNFTKEKQSKQKVEEITLNNNNKQCLETQKQLELKKINLYQEILDILENNNNNKFKGFNTKSTQNEQSQFQSKLQNALNRVFSVLTNWELLSIQQINQACESFFCIAKSQLSFILVENQNLHQLEFLINSQNIPLNIQVAVIESIIFMSDTLSIQKVMVSQKILQILIVLALTSCDENKIKQFDKQLRFLALKALCLLAGIYNRKIYIPGETQEKNKLRNIFINQGGLLAIFTISRKALEEEIREFPKKEFFQTLWNVDWQYQLNVLKKYQAQILIQEQLKENESEQKDKKEQIIQNTAKSNQISEQILNLNENFKVSLNKEQQQTPNFQKQTNNDQMNQKLNEISNKNEKIWNLLIQEKEKQQLDEKEIMLPNILFNYYSIQEMQELIEKILNSFEKYQQRKVRESQAKQLKKSRQNKYIQSKQQQTRNYQNSTNDDFNFINVFWSKTQNSTVEQRNDQCGISQYKLNQNLNDQQSKGLNEVQIQRKKQMKFQKQYVMEQEKLLLIKQNELRNIQQDQTLAQSNKFYYHEFNQNFPKENINQENKNSSIGDKIKFLRRKSNRENYEIQLGQIQKRKEECIKKVQKWEENKKKYLIDQKMIEKDEFQQKRLFLNIKPQKKKQSSKTTSSVLQGFQTLEEIDKKLNQLHKNNNGLPLSKQQLAYLKNEIEYNVQLLSDDKKIRYFLKQNKKHNILSKKDIIQILYQNDLQKRINDIEEYKNSNGNDIKQLNLFKKISQSPYSNLELFKTQVGDKYI